MHALTIGWICMAMSALPQQNAQVFEGAQWIQDPVFQGVEPADIYHREKVDPPEVDGPKNVHTLLRKEITLREKPVSALLAITGDDYYKFYANGRYVVQGPEPGYPFAHPFYWLEIVDYLKSGANCLGAHAYYQGLNNRVWNSGDNRAGFMLALTVKYADGSEERFVTDTTWKCHPLEAFPTGETTGYKTQFLENIDLRKMPAGWRETGFDDSGWGAPITPAATWTDSPSPAHAFVKQITRPLQITRTEPVEKKALGPNDYFYDFGHEIVGCTRVRVQGEAGGSLTVRHGEELTEDGRVRYEMRCNCTYEEKPVLSGGEDLIEFYDYRAFRYLEVLGAPEEPEVWVDVQHHPFDPERAVLESDNELLEDIWKLCRTGVQMGSQGGFLDCPSREKGQYLGDAVITARSHMWLTADPSLTKKALYNFCNSRRIHEGLMAVAPGSFMQEIAEYSLQYPLMLAAYYRHSGDRAFTEAIIDTVFDGLYGYFAGFENEHGLLHNITKDEEKWVLVDWPKNLRDGYDYDYAKGKANTVLNAFYYGALRCAADLCEQLGRDGSAYAAKAERVAAGFASQLAGPATGLYVDAPGSEHSALHANAIPLFFGLTAGADKDAMLELIRERRLSCGVYIASYVIEACFRNGAPELGYALITSSDEHSWHEMLSHGATACMEAWGPDQKWNTSWCHPWSSSPVYLLAEHVLGLSPAQPGWETVRFAPTPIEGLPPIQLTVPHAHGAITVRHVPGEGYAITLPTDVPVEIDAPEDVTVRERHAVSHDAPQPLSREDRDLLAEHGWQKRVGWNKRALWVSVGDQMAYLLDGWTPVWQARCATAAAGTGGVLDSLCTPLGWHHIFEKIGKDAPRGQVFRARKATGEIWKPGGDTEEDLVLTRILQLTGEEMGKNLGKTEDGVCVDTLERCIYIHGTNAPDMLGVPSSHGCVRLHNDDVIDLFSKVAEGTPVLITERESGHAVSSE